jgi:hypothetical protein
MAKAYEKAEDNAMNAIGRPRRVDEITSDAEPGRGRRLRLDQGEPRF